MQIRRCPLCNHEECTQTTTADYTEFLDCKTYGTKLHICSSIIDDFGASKEYQKMLNLVCERIVRVPLAPNRHYWRFYYDPAEENMERVEYVNLYSLLKNYPVSLIDVTNRTLLNLAYKFPSFGEKFIESGDIIRLCYPEDIQAPAAAGVLKMLEQMGYFAIYGHSYSISVDGWKKIESLQKENIVSKQGFVAMRFGEETKDIREAFRYGINDAGYIMRAIDEKEHNNQIVPEIFYEIERSKFVVVDVTYPNYGAYYEAGYAQGLGKQVIVCCSREAFENRDGTHERPHFDISQKSMVIWNDIEDLKSRLKKRIEATVN